MAQGTYAEIVEILERHGDEVLGKWQEAQSGALGAGPAEQAEIRRHSGEFLELLRTAAGTASGDSVDGQEWREVRRFLEEMSRNRAHRGYSPSQTAMFVFSLKRPLLERLQAAHGNDAGRLARATWIATTLLDRLGLFTTEVHQKGREELIARQQQEMLELSTPVVQLWDGILALPLIGTLDSARTQVVMESLLQRIVETGSGIAIIDITGVPTVDTLVAQHLLKTVAAARLMGADCIISGIRPQIAQTIVHLGVDLQDVATKATLADAFSVALRRTGLMVTRSRASGADTAVSAVR